ncbi:MAG TPA: hypothetical protein VMQ60_13405, partial [Acidobacteriaceae bacterium]|nr:hypothetical protein [Acidobacteriaceae bacterium]
MGIAPLLSASTTAVILADGQNLRICPSCPTNPGWVIARGSARPPVLPPPNRQRRTYNAPPPPVPPITSP